MANLYNLLEGVLNSIESGLKEDISDKVLAEAGYCCFMPTVKVKTPANIPEGSGGFRFLVSLCANFRFIGPSDVELNMAVAKISVTLSVSALFYSYQISRVLGNGRFMILIVTLLIMGCFY